MSINELDRSRLLPLAGLIAPLGAVLLARILLSAGPSAAPAAGLDAYDQLPSVVPVVASPLSDTQRAAMNYLASLPSGSNARSPMTKPSVQEHVERPPEEEPVERIEDPTNRLVLNSIMGKGSRALASISNKVYHVGERPLPDWEIAEIDASGRVVVLRHSSGQQVRLTYRVKERGR